MYCIVLYACMHACMHTSCLRLCSLWMPLYRSIYLSIFLSTYIHIYLFTDLPTYLPTYLIYIPTYLSICLSIHLSTPAIKSRDLTIYLLQSYFSLRNSYGLSELDGDVARRVLWYPGFCLKRNLKVCCCCLVTRFWSAQAWCKGQLLKPDKLGSCFGV